MKSSSLTIPSFKQLFLSGISIFLGAFFFTVLISALFSLQESTQKNAAQSLGGDVKITNTQFFTEEENTQIQKYAEEKNISLSFSESFTGMILSEKNEELTSISVVDDLYPLYGEVKLQDKNTDFSLPRENEIFLDSSFFNEKKLTRGDKITLGEGTFVVAGFFESLPHVQNAFSFFSSSAIISGKGLEQTKIDLAQNRSTHSILMKFSQQVEGGKKTEDDLKKIFPEKSVRISSTQNGSDTSSRIFSEVQKISLSLISVLTLLCSTSFFLGVYIYIQAQSRSIAVLKSLGMPFRDIVKKYALSVGIFWGGVGFVGFLAGVLLLFFVYPEISELFGHNLWFSQRALLSGLFLIVLLPFTALFLMLRQFFSLSPALLLKGNDASESGSQKNTPAEKRKSVFVFSGLLLPFAFLLAILSGSLLFPVMFFGGIALLFFVFYGVLIELFRGIRAVQNMIPFFSVRMSLSFFTEPGQKKYFILSGFFALFFILSTAATLQKSFLENLQTLSGENAPSSFFLDIKSDQVEEFTEILADHGEVEVFSILRAKIVSLAGRDVQKSDERGLTRAFNIGFSDDLGESEKLIEGKKWGKNTEEKWVSVESDFAEKNDVRVGDIIIFDVLGRSISFTVSSIRELEQRDFNPWFMFVFPENSVKAVPRSHIGFWWADDEATVSAQKSEIVRTFPNVSALETGAIKKSLADVFAVLESGIGSIGLLLVIASSITLFSFLFETSAARKKTKILLQKMGVSRLMTRNIFLFEVMFLLVLPFLFATLFSLVAVWILSFLVFDFTALSVSLVPFGLFGIIFVGGVLIGFRK